jgi:citrate lyase subunit beta/citryl-CoA lyase
MQSNHPSGAKIGEAGQRGEDIRGDIFACVDLNARGGVNIDLASKVAVYYGNAIRQQATAVLSRLGVSAANVRLEDQGALPFVIEARIEAAARRAGAGQGKDGRMERGVAVPKASERRRLRRSRLYLPGNEPRFMINAGLHGPDGIILDLEDSVHPSAKDAARLLVRNALREVDFGTAERMVRINQGELGFADLEVIVPEQPDLILIPKVEQADEVRAVAAAIDRSQKQHNVHRALHLMPILESATGIENAYAIASASERVVALTIGLEDFTADLGVVKTKEGAETLWARSRLVNAARAAGLQAIDSVYGELEDLVGLSTWIERSRAMGFVGMGCVHPRQIPIIHQGFAPSREEIDRALGIVAAYAEAKAKGLAVVNLGAKMIDPPVDERALSLVEQAKSMGLVEESDCGSTN